MIDDETPKNGDAPVTLLNTPKIRDDDFGYTLDWANRDGSPLTSARRGGKALVLGLMRKRGWE